MSILLNTYKKEKGFIWTGLIGIVLGLICIVFYFIHGNEIPPEGKWTKAITFDLAIGIFSLTTAVLLPFVEMKSQQRKRFTYPLIASFWLAYAIETIQNARGFDPRFTKAGLLYDHLIGLTLGIVSVVIIVCLVSFMITVFKQKNSQHPLLLLSIRYACLSIMLAVLAGVWMTILLGRVTSDGVDIMTLHFAGFHGFQATPMIGWFLSNSNISSIIAKRVTHIGGIAWLVFCLCLFIQTGLGYSVYHFSVVLVFAGLTLGLWFFTAIYSFYQYIQTRKVQRKNHNVRTII